MFVKGIDQNTNPEETPKGYIYWGKNGIFSTKLDASDDIFSISGNSVGKNREGRNFTTSITNALIKKTNCKWISSGTLKLTPDGFATRTVDFGSGACDDDATFTVSDQTISFKLQ